MNTTTEAAVTEPDTIECGGLVWGKRQSDRLTYMAQLAGVGRFRVTQYSHNDGEWCVGRWNWQTDFYLPAGIEQRPKALKMEASGITQEQEEAMLACLNARDQFIEDMRQLLNALSPGDEYAQGRRAGQEEIKQRVITFLQ